MALHRTNQLNGKLIIINSLFSEYMEIIYSILFPILATCWVQAYFGTSNYAFSHPGCKHIFLQLRAIMHSEVKLWTLTNRTTEHIFQEDQTRVGEKEANLIDPIWRSVAPLPWASNGRREEGKMKEEKGARPHGVGSVGTEGATAERTNGPVAEGWCEGRGWRGMEEADGRGVACIAKFKRRAWRRREWDSGGGGGGGRRRDGRGRRRQQADGVSNARGRPNPNKARPNRNKRLLSLKRKRVQGSSV